MIIVENIFDGIEHLDGNTGMVELIRQNNPNQKIHLLMGKNHYSALMQNLVKHSIDISNIVFHQITPLGGIFKDYRKFKLTFDIVRETFQYAKKNNEDKIIFLFGTPFLIYFVKIFCFFNKNIDICILLHGNLEKIDFQEYVKNAVKNKIIVFLYILFFGLRLPLMLPTPQNLKYLVYGDCIKNNAVKQIQKLKNEIITIPHPYLYDELDIHNVDQAKLNFGVIGITDIRKNSKHLRSLVQALNKIQEKNFSLSFAGKINDDDMLIDMLNKSEFADKETITKNFISTEQRNNIIEKMDYVLYANYLDTYKYTASGVINDAINYEKPIIAIRNDYIKYFFNKYGDIGYLCNSYEEFENAVISIIKDFQNDRYKQQVENIKNIKVGTSIENIKFKF